jgi:hypothetical protein
MSSVDLSEVVAKIPRSIRSSLSTQLVDILLNAKGGDKLSSSLAKSFLYLWQKDRLAEDEGMDVLLKAALSLDAEATLKQLSESNLSEVADAIQKLSKKG